MWTGAIARRKTIRCARRHTSPLEVHTHFIYIDENLPTGINICVNNSFQLVLVAGIDMINANDVNIDNMFSFSIFLIIQWTPSHRFFWLNCNPENFPGFLTINFSHQFTWGLQHLQSYQTGLFRKSFNQRLFPSLKHIFYTLAVVSTFQQPKVRKINTEILHEFSLYGFFWTRPPSRFVCFSLRWIWKPFYVC